MLVPVDCRKSDPGQADVALSVLTVQWQKSIIGFSSSPQVP